MPVGEDQKQHLELSRDIAGKFNRDFDAPGFFPLPEPMYQGPGARIMSLGGRVEEDVEVGSVRRIAHQPARYRGRHRQEDQARHVSDSDALPSEVKGLGEGANEAANLVGIYAVLTGQSEQAVLDEFGGKGFGVFKPALADLAVAKLGPVADNDAPPDERSGRGRRRISADGGERANAIARAGHGRSPHASSASGGPEPSQQKPGSPSASSSPAAYLLAAHLLASTGEAGLKRIHPDHLR